MDYVCKLAAREKVWWGKCSWLAKWFAVDVDMWLTVDCITIELSISA